MAEGKYGFRMARRDLTPKKHVAIAEEAVRVIHNPVQIVLVTMVKLRCGSLVTDALALAKCRVTIENRAPIVPERGNINVTAVAVEALHTDPSIVQQGINVDARPQHQHHGHLAVSFAAEDVLSGFGGVLEPFNDVCT